MERGDVLTPGYAGAASITENYVEKTFPGEPVFMLCGCRRRDAGGGRRRQESGAGRAQAASRSRPSFAVLSEPDAKNDQEGSADGINQCQRGGNDAQVADGFVQEPLGLPFLVTEYKPGQYSGQ